MKPYLVDVPVKINIWIRPECQKRQFEVIQQARPSILFIQSDGGRNEDEWEKIYQNRKLIDEGVDWDCTIIRLYESENKGLYATGLKMREIIWQHVDRCIFLEDDQLPSISFFRYCSELLEKYKDDTRIECICGFNNLEVWDKASSDYFFSRRGSIWGLATWKRVADEWNDFSYAEDPYTMNLLKQQTKNDRRTWDKTTGYAKNTNFEGHLPAGEFYHDFFVYSQHRLQIVPKYNLISNIGATSDSTHAADISIMPRRTRTQFNSKAYELSFPLKHPKYVIPDEEYAEKRDRLLTINHPILRHIRMIERAALLLKTGDFDGLVLNVKKRLSKIQNKYNEK